MQTTNATKLLVNRFAIGSLSHGLRAPNQNEEIGKKKMEGEKSSETDSNDRPCDLQSHALTPELPEHPWLSVYLYFA